MTILPHAASRQRPSADLLAQKLAVHLGSPWNAALTFNVDVLDTRYEVKVGDIGGVTQVILMIDIAKCLYARPL